MAIIQKQEISTLENGLDSFNPNTRKDSLLRLLQLAEEGALSLPEQREIANLHCHSFFSYNGYGYSPTHIAWLGRKLGAKFMGIVDFDVLDGVDEFLESCRLAGIYGSAGMETRVFIPEYADKEINSPGEPGICYHMGSGFTQNRTPDEAAVLLMELKTRAMERNQAMLDKLNSYLAPLTLDYETDILTITPNRNATERHMLDQIIAKSLTELDDPVKFWSGKLGLTVDETKKVLDNKAAFSNLVRKKLMKRGGAGYTQPSPESFPMIDQLNGIIEACGALPCFAWLDGTSSGEADINSLLDMMADKGIAAVNIIPDRNWNIQDAALKAVKLQNLYAFTAAAQDRHLPILVGTEMNSNGQRLIDDWDAPELDPVRQAFVEGAYFIYGHTILLKQWELGWQSQWAGKYLPDRSARNAFFQKAGRMMPPELLPKLTSIIITEKMEPQVILDTINKAKENKNDIQV